MNSAVINLLVDPKLKAQVKAYAKGLGLDLSTIIDNYLRTLLKTKAVVFTPNGAFPVRLASAWTEKKIKNAKKNADKIIIVDDVNTYLKQL